MAKKQAVANLKNTDVDTLVNFSIMMGKLSEDGKYEMMKKIMGFINTGDKSLLCKGENITQ